MKEKFLRWNNGYKTAVCIENNRKRGLIMKMLKIMFCISSLFVTVLLVACVVNNDGTNGHEPIIVEKLEDIAYDVNPSGEYTVYLEENGIYKPYLVLTNNYNGNCLLLRKHVLNENRIYNQEMEYSAYYEDSDIDTFLNTEYIELFSDTIREDIIDSEIIITAKESLEFSGDDTKTINRKVFLLSCAELGETMFRGRVKEGETIIYFDHQRKRIAYDEDGNARNWWIRTSDTTDKNSIFAVIFNGAFGFTGVDTIHGLVQNGVRPAFCMSPDTPVTLANIEGINMYVLNIEKDK